MGELAAEAAGVDTEAGSTASVAELLGRTEIERLTSELRRALPGGGPTSEIRPLADFTAALGAPVLCAFLLLGLAAATAGCTGSEETGAWPIRSPGASSVTAPAAVETTPPAQVAPQITPEPAEPVAFSETTWFDGCALTQKGVLWRSIDRSALGADDKRALCDCFSTLDRRWTNRLTYLFRNAKPTEIAKALEEMGACCDAEDKAADAACGEVAKTHSAVQQRVTALRFGGAVMYKGVCFD